MDADGSPVTVSWSGDSRRNIIVWMDHRAVEQAERINSRNNPVLQYCGGALSPEMQPPKVLQQLVGSCCGFLCYAATHHPQLVASLYLSSQGSHSSKCVHQISIEVP